METRDWMVQAGINDRYADQPTIAFRQLLSATTQGPFPVISKATKWLGCLVTCDGNGNGTFSIALPGAAANPVNVATKTFVGPFVLAPGSSLSVGWVDGSPNVTVLTWPDPMGLILNRIDEYFDAMKKQGR